ncbi:MAG: diacylglycerol/lipid kinase family protein [Pyrinomonadaceae bacterium]
MTTRKAILISNPKTGRYASRRLPPIEDVYAQLKSHNLDVELISTSGPGDATRIAATAARNGVCDVIVAGGDGTINEALQGLVGTNARLAILPRGTANVLARELGLPLDCKRAAEIIARAKTRRIHVGCAVDEKNGTRRYFLLMAGIGLDASVVRRVHPELKKRFGKGAFWFSGLSHLADWKPKAFEIEVNGETFSPTFVTIGKAATYGGDLTVTPRAQLDQPDFEICIIESYSRLRYLHLLSHAMRSGGVPADKSGVRFLRATRARATGEVGVQVDGELIGNLPMTFEIARETIEVIVP